MESSFCFTYAPLAAVRTLFSIMKTYPSRSNAKSALQEHKRVKVKTHAHTRCACKVDNVGMWCILAMWPSHLAAIKAPKIMVNTVIFIGVEKVFLGGRGMQLLKSFVCRVNV